MYEVISTIAVGHQGVVELARNATGELVAIKRLHNPSTSEADARLARRRLAREASLLAELALPNVVPLLDVIETDDELSLVMPYLEGGSLHDRVINNGVLTSTEVYALASPLLEALAVLHRQGIVHRDIKPANILFDRTGSLASGDATPYLIDFGIGQSTDFTVGLSDTQALLGTPAFMAPERARGETASAASDIYSLGATLRFALTGMPPHGVGDVATMVRRAQAGQLEPLPANLNPQLATLLNQMCALAPEDRPSAARLVAGPYGTLIAPTSDVLFSGATTRTTKRQKVPRHKRWLAPTLAGLGLLALLGVSTAIYFTSKPPSRSAEAGVTSTFDTASPENTSTTVNTTTPSTTEAQCVPLPYQGCNDSEPAAGTNGQECLPGFFDHDEDPDNGCEATGDSTSEFRLEVGSVQGTIIPVGNVDKVLVPVTDEWQLFCDGTLTLTLAAPTGLDLEMTVFNRGREMTSMEVQGNSTKSLKIGEPSCFTNDSTTLEVIIRGVRGRSSAPWTLSRSGSW